MGMAKGPVLTRDRESGSRERHREIESERGDRDRDARAPLRTLHLAAARDAVGYILLFLRVINFDRGELFLEFLHIAHVR